MMRRATFLPLFAAVFSLIVRSTTEARQLQDAVGLAPLQALAASALLPAASGQLCSAVCTTPTFFRSSLPGYSPETLACAVNIPSAGLVAGYQLSTEAACTVAVAGTVVTSQEYSCVCQDGSQTQGLEPVVGQESCSTACNQSIDGMTGSAVSVNSTAGNYICLASPEIGYNNRFGTTVAESGPGSTACTYAADGAATADASFSCLCLFSTSSTAALMKPAVALPTAG